MIPNELEKVANNLIDGYFESRAKELDSISLEDLLVNANPYLFCLNGVGRVDKIIEELLRERMHPFEEKALSQLMARLRTQVSAASDTALIQLLRDYSGVQRINYNSTLARVSNRLCKEFCNKFLLPVGSIDWEKLVLFSPYAGGRKKEEVPNGVGGG